MSACPTSTHRYCLPADHTTAYSWHLYDQYLCIAGFNIEVSVMAHTGTAQSSQDRSHQTPAYAQPAPQTVPDAPQRQTKAPVPQNALAGFHKLQLQAPAAADTQASGMPALTAGAKGLKAAAGNAGSPCQKDLKSLIHHEFARLMATGTYTPNEAAVLAIQIVSHQH